MGLSTAMSTAVQGMTVQSVRFQHLGNNIANSSTVAYKTSDVEFAEAMATTNGSQWPNGARVQPGAGVLTVGTTTDFGNGQVKDDQQVGHFAIVGEGYLSVEVAGEALVTRAGDFSLIEDPASAGNFIFMRATGAILQGSATAGGALGGSVSFDARPTSVVVGVNGSVSVTPATVNISNGFVGVRRFLNENALLKREGQTFAETPQATPFTTDPEVPGAGGAGVLRQGALEQSNVDLTTEFTRMITTQTAFTANSKTIKTAEEMLQTVLNLAR